MSYRNNIKLKKAVEPVQCVCSYCGFLGRDKDDIASIFKSKACTECFSLFYNDINKNRRPTREVVRSRMNIFIEEV